MTTPRVSVLVLNLNGRGHLATCLPSLKAQTYPRDRLDIVVVDNGSSDDSIAFVRREHPEVRIVAFDSNRGFAAPYNEAARQSESPFVAFLNNDTRVEPDWVTELVAAVERHHVACAAARMLDWNGDRIDFAGGVVSFVGHCWPRGAGEPAATEYPEGPALFACGGAMLVNRKAFLDAGGFDEDFFAYFEDVDVGWRLALLGHDTVFAPRAVTYHRAHGTAGRIAMASRLRLYERNALAMIYKNYDDDTLRRVLPAAVALTYARALAHLGVDPAGYVLGRTPPQINRIPSRTAATLIALEDFASDLPRLTAKRGAIQLARRRCDDELFPRFGDPFKLHETGGAYEEVARALIDTFDIRALFEGRGSRGRRGPQPTPEPPPGIVPSVAIDDTPRVSIVILTAVGSTFLEECLTSIAEQNYPRECCEVIIVDNASAEDPSAAAARLYPRARVIRNETNLGFATANNIGAREATGDFLVFLNDDTRVHPDWLRELVGVAKRRGAVCVGARLVNWDGDLIDFCGGSVNFQGKGFQDRIGYPIDRVVAPEAPILFACGAAMLVDRQIFLDHGGWDEGTFAYYEDVELGWRLWLLGHSVWLAPNATVYHRHNGTSGQWAQAPRLRLFERNALRMVFTHLEEDMLGRVLPAAMLLTGDRALLRTTIHRGFAHGKTSASRSLGRRLSARRLVWIARRGLSQQGARRELGLSTNLRRVGVKGLVKAAGYAASEITSGEFGGHGTRRPYMIELGAQSASFDAHAEGVPVETVAELLGLRDFLDSLPELSKRRRWLQSRRRRSDREILGAFGRWWLSPVSAAWQEAHFELTDNLVAAFGIADFR